MSMNEKDARYQVDELLAEITKNYSKIEEIARRYNLRVRYEGPVGYGDSGWYDPDDAEWVASSGSC